MGLGRLLCPPARPALPSPLEAHYGAARAKSRASMQGCPLAHQAVPWHTAVMPVISHHLCWCSKHPLHAAWDRPATAGTCSVRKQSAAL